MILGIRPNEPIFYVFAPNDPGSTPDIAEWNAFHTRMKHRPRTEKTPNSLPSTITNSESFLFDLLFPKDEVQK